MPLLRRRVSRGLPAVLGTPDLFATAYGNVGSSIYYALGVTAIYALGMTPVTFAISGLIFAFTAATYAEATARFPEAGGSASFSRRAFNEAVSFFAAWAQMLNYTVTIAISSYTVPPYLSVLPGLHSLHTGYGQLVVRRVPRASCSPCSTSAASRSRRGSTSSSRSPTWQRRRCS